MKKAIFSLALLALFSCSDDDLLSTTEAKKKNNETSRLLNLMPFDASCINLSTVDNDPLGNNRECIQNQIDLAKANGYDGLQIGALDCYVNVTFAANKSLHIPSDFALVMDANTIFRVTPNSVAGYAFMDIGGTYSVPDIANVSVSGGQIYGDRVLHNNAVVHGHLIRITSAHDVSLKSVAMREANSDGLYISGKVISNQPNYTQPYNITVSHCTFERNRRANISVTDGYNMEIAYCTFRDAGINMSPSLGALPKMSVNVEGDRVWNTAHTELVWLKHPHDISIHDNNEEGSIHGAYFASLADHVTIANNTSKSPIGYVYGDNITISSNQVTNSNFGIMAGFDSAVSIVNHDNLIQDNVVEDCNIGLILYNRETVVTGNTFTDCTAYGMSFSNVSDSRIESNTITSTVSGSSGIKVTNSTMADELYIQYNDINIDGGATSTGIWLQNINVAAGQENYKVYVWGNDISTTGSCKFAGVGGFEVDGNSFVTLGSVSVVGGRSMTMTLNSILNNSPNANANALYLNNNPLANIVKDNMIENMSTNANAHCTQITNCANLTFTGNTLKQPVTRTLHITNLTDSDVSSNTGVIGNVSLFIYATSATNCTFLGNQADSAPFTRQSINGVVTVL